MRRSGASLLRQCSSQAKSRTMHYHLGSDLVRSVHWPGLPGHWPGGSAEGATGMSVGFQAVLAGGATCLVAERRTYGGCGSFGTRQQMADSQPVRARQM